MLGNKTELLGRKNGQNVGDETDKMHTKLQKGAKVTTQVVTRDFHPVAMWSEFGAAAQLQPSLVL
eukprot:4221371-Amphidinium_carterae.1